jgi:hypothetical protein
MLIVFKTYESFDRTYIGRALERGSRKRARYRCYACVLHADIISGRFT